MYKRNENIKDENLDWDDESKDEIQEKNIKVTLEPEVKSEKLSPKKEISFEIMSDKKSHIMTLFHKYEYVSLGLIILVLPYLVGLLFTFVLFYIYSGITLDKVFIIEKEHNILEFWTIGIYAFVTSWIIWIILKTLNDSR